MEFTLEILRYVAIVIAAASGIWALLHKLFEEDAAGRRRLTRAGRIALTLMVAGAAVGVGSLWLQGRVAQEGRREAELGARLGTSLTQLRVEWTFEQPEQPRVDVPPCGEFELRPDGKRFESFYPALAASPPWSAPARSVVLVLPLDEPATSAPSRDHLSTAGAQRRESGAGTGSRNASPVHVLPLGVIELAVADNEEDIAKPMQKVRMLAMSATVEFREEVMRCEDATDHLYPRRIERERKCDVAAEVARHDGSVTLTWDLDPQCLANGVDSADRSARPTARLPQRMMFFVLTDIATLPFDPSNFAQADATLPWDFVTPPRQTRHASRLRLVPNGDETLAVEYEMWLQRTLPMAGKGGGAEVKFDYPIMGIWAGTRRDAAQAPPE